MSTNPTPKVSKKSSDTSSTTSKQSKDGINTGARTQAFHDFYSQIFTPKRWERLYTALAESTDLVALVNPYVPTRWVAKELGIANAKQSTAFKSSFTKGLPIYELPNKNNTPGIQSGTNIDTITTSTTNNTSTTSTQFDALADVDEKGFTSRWPIKLPQVGHQNGDGQLDIALANQSGGMGILLGQNDTNNSDSDDNPNQVEHLAAVGGYVSGFGPTRDKYGWYLMDLASIAAPLILNPQPGEKVLDLCAAPGGKSLILAYLMLFRDTLQTRTNEIDGIMTRMHDFTRLHTQQQTNAIGYTTFENENVLSMNQDVIEQFENGLNEQKVEDFDEFTQPVVISSKKLKRYMGRFEDMVNNTTNQTTITNLMMNSSNNQNGTNIQNDDNINANNNIPLLSVDNVAARSQVLYENDEIIKAILTARNHSSKFKTKNEMDRDRYLEEQKLLQQQEKLQLEQEQLLHNIAQTSPNQQPNENEQAMLHNNTIELDLIKDLQYERELRQLHGVILNPIALRKQMNISDTSDSDNSDSDDGDEELSTKHKHLVKQNKVFTHKDDKIIPKKTEMTIADKEAAQQRRQAKIDAKEKALKEKEKRRLERQKLDAIRLRSRLVLNDVSIPRVKRLQKVIQSYLPMKYVPLIEITNVDASTAQQFTLITRNSQGDISVKKISKKGSGSALEKDVQERAKEGEYDCVLVDAPCSSDRHIIHDNALASWNIAYTKSQAKRQYGLLLAAIKSLKIGGRCVYSTCSLSPYENDGVVQQVVKTLGDDVVKVVKFKLDVGEKTGLGWILLPDQPNCQWGPLYMSLLQRIG